MKKYLVAGAVAIMVFAFSAMAASLSVDGGALQIGSDDTICDTDGVSVAYRKWEDDGAFVQYFDVEALSDSCSGEEVSLWVTQGDERNYVDSKIVPAGGGTVAFENTAQISAADIDGVEVKLQTIPES